MINGTLSTVTYVLRLEDDCYYVGKTTELKKRITKHFSNKGSTWTKLHKPVELIGVLEDDVEPKMTAAMIDQHGHEKVRGSHYTSIEPKKQVKFLERWGFYD